jgi:ribosomal protein S8
MLLNFNYFISGINLSSFSKQNSITVSNNKLNIKVAFKLFNEGLIRGYKYNSKKITIFLKYDTQGNYSVIKKINSGISKGRLVFLSIKQISKLVHTSEIYLISTIKGILTAKECLFYNTGGVFICKIII